MYYMNTTIPVPSRQRLVAERMRRRWTQLEVADQLGTTPGNVSRWERCITSPGPYFRRKLCELFGRSAHELGLTWDESTDALSHHAQNAALMTLSYVSANSGLHELSLPELENEDEGLLAQTVAQWLQTGLNRVLIPAKAGDVVLVVLNSNVDTRPSSLQKR
jgi:transcriptional regulator with XRE-family HTH domain